MIGTFYVRSSNCSAVPLRISGLRWCGIFFITFIFPSPAANIFRTFKDHSSFYDFIWPICKDLAMVYTVPGVIYLEYLLHDIHTGRLKIFWNMMNIIIQSQGS